MKYRIIKEENKEYNLTHYFLQTKQWSFLGTTWITEKDGRLPIVFYSVEQVMEYLKPKSPKVIHTLVREGEI